ncbi:MAG TPA: hypothetical protein DF712_15930 [Balneola sp.]|nr:hypothetical protein [Balneola sp.]|tara:strand:+ start:3476 stop:4015 length:540 start_codon:yes stop_codon:yes gene_type:complete
MECYWINNNKYKLSMLLLIIPFLLNGNCSTNTDVEEGPVPFEILKEYVSYSTNGESESINKCDFDYSNVERPSYSEKLSGIELKIKNSSDFETFIECNDSVSIDFQKEFIIGGLTSLQGNWIYVNDQKLEFKNDTLIYHIGILRGFNAQPSRGIYMIKVQSIKYSEYPISFNVYWEEGE